jgi:hypothetical protein
MYIVDMLKNWMLWTWNSYGDLWGTHDYKFTWFYIGFEKEKGLTWSSHYS